MEDRHRIDVWLKFVCLFKHRNEAAEACRGGHVKINGVRAKPAAAVHEEDVVEFLQGTHYRRVVVSHLPEKQAAKDEARAMYADQTPKQEVDITRTAMRERGQGRPTKRERRELDKIRR
ncbi:MAG TPA: S4 domain-containing protein [Thermoanaerobaculia bacterium]|nr:S4 domain-containing protein [Thermoanaerobaculia bacterium]